MGRGNRQGMLFANRSGTLLQRTLNYTSLFQGVESYDAF
jgi:hypothetical protein